MFARFVQLLAIFHDYFIKHFVISLYRKNILTLHVGMSKMGFIPVTQCELCCNFLACSLFANFEGL